jgi:hypothetical protein
MAPSKNSPLAGFYTMKTERNQVVVKNFGGDILYWGAHTVSSKTKTTQSGSPTIVPRTTFCEKTQGQRQSWPKRCKTTKK